MDIRSASFLTIIRFLWLAWDRMVTHLSPAKKFHIDNEMRKSARRVFQRPSGQVVLRISRDSSTHALSQVLSSGSSTPD